MVKSKKISRKAKFCVLTLILALSLQAASLVSAAVSNSYTVSASTGNLNEGPETVNIAYSLSVQVSHPGTAMNVSATIWSVTISQGTVTITASGPVSGSVSEPLPLGESLTIPVASAFSATVKATASSQISVAGGSANESTLEWSSQGTRSFLVNVPSSAPLGSSVNVSLPISIVLNVGGSVGVGPFSYSLGGLPIGTIQASPTVVSSMTIGRPQSPLNFGLAQFALLLMRGGPYDLVMVAIVAAGLAAIDVHNRHFSPRTNLVQGNVAAISGAILLYLFLQQTAALGNSINPQVLSAGNQNTFYAAPAILLGFITLFAFLIVLGRILLALRFPVGKGLVNNSSDLLIAILVLLAFASALSNENNGALVWVYLLPAIVARISTKLSR